MFTRGLVIARHLKLFAPHLGANDGPINPDHFETWFLHAAEDTTWPSQLSLTGDSTNWGFSSGNGHSALIDRFD
jgi:hypothetical protein